MVGSGQGIGWGRVVGLGQGVGYMWGQMDVGQDRLQLSERMWD